MLDVQYETTVKWVGSDGPDTKPVPVQLFPQGEEAKGFYPVDGPPGEYQVEVIGKKAGKDVGRATARFNVFRDDRELENPAADRALLRQIAEITGGVSVDTRRSGQAV